MYRLVAVLGGLCKENPLGHRQQRVQSLRLPAQHQMVPTDLWRAVYQDNWGFLPSAFRAARVARLPIQMLPRGIRWTAITLPYNRRLLPYPNDERRAAAKVRPQRAIAVRYSARSSMHRAMSRQSASKSGQRFRGSRTKISAVRNARCFGLRCAAVQASLPRGRDR